MATHIGFTGCCGGVIFYGFEDYSSIVAEQSLLRLQRTTMNSWGIAHVILKESDDKRLSSTFEKMGWKRSFSDIVNPNTKNKLYGWYFDLTEFLKHETKPKPLVNKLFG